MTQRGNVTIVVAVILGIAAFGAAGLARLGATAVGRARAQAAADAAALAGAADGEEAANTIAERNGAELTGWETDGDDVIVTIRRGPHTARARARWEPLEDDPVPTTPDSPPGSRTLPTRGHEATR